MVREKIRESRPQESEEQMSRLDLLLQLLQRCGEDYYEVRRTARSTTSSTSSAPPQPLYFSIYLPCGSNRSPKIKLCYMRLSDDTRLNIHLINRFKLSKNDDIFLLIFGATINHGIYKKTM